MNRSVISANELKTRGVSILEEATGDDTEAIISVRGKERYVVLPIQKYNYLRECELDAAIRETERDLKMRRFSKISVKEHLRKLKHA